MASIWPLFEHAEKKNDQPANQNKSSDCTKEYGLRHGTLLNGEIEVMDHRKEQDGATQYGCYDAGDNHHLTLLYSSNVAQQAERARQCER